ncbi:ferredoxin [Nocardia sp. NPDC052112]|uniref:ferredoxin n=1 Tax=Nocardia sp. NPDC052112 TaxID=3155646 RepID=UPI0034181C24
MKIFVDPQKCEGHALCAAIAPKVFEVGADDLSRVIDPAPAEKFWPDIRAAVSSCPTLAITASYDVADRE